MAHILFIVLTEVFSIYVFKLSSRQYYGITTQGNALVNYGYSSCGSKLSLQPLVLVVTYLAVLICRCMNLLSILQYLSWIATGTGFLFANIFYIGTKETLKTRERKRSAYIDMVREDVN